MKKYGEKIVVKALFISAVFTILVTIGIIFVLVYETAIFFQHVSFIDFITDSQWTPLFTDKHYGIATLLSGTILTTLVAIIIAIPVGLMIAIYLNEYANHKFRTIIKPILELIASIPTVIYGFFALVFITPLLQTFIPGLAGFSALSAGIVMGVMIIPYVSSLSEDALYAVPKSLRDASYGMGSTRFQTVFKVTLPAASSGVIVAIILAISRAIGETMIVAIAAGQQPRLTLNPLVPIETITAYIVQVSLGDVPHDSIEYRSIFAAGIALFVFTFALNNISFYLRKKYTEKYD